MLLAILMFVLVVGVILLGPIAFIIAMIANNKLNKLISRLEEKGVIDAKTYEYSPPPKVVTKPPQPIEETPASIEEVEPKETPKTPAIPKEAQKDTPPIITKAINKSNADTLEQSIGTLWVLIAGIITIAVGVIFFLKYAYDNSLLDPLGRVVVVSISGLVTLFVAELTRRRGYDIVARLVTALGFIILYAAVFSAYQFYEIIDSVPAFAISILITAAAMLYAVALDELLIAALSLIGGFLAPLILSTGENKPLSLFIYLLALGLGAIGCAYYRRWRVVNLLSFSGTFFLYTVWFEKFYRDTINLEQQPPKQFLIALGGIAVFFVVYLILPLFNGIIKKVKSKREDFLLVLANAGATFYYLWTILFTHYRVELAYCAALMCAAHLIVMMIVMRRNEEDTNLRVMLTVIGLSFLTIVFPIYFKMYAISVAWAIEAVVLVVLAMRYKSLWTQIVAAVAALLSVGQLLSKMPMHGAAFRLAINPIFGTWLLVFAAIFVVHLLYRRREEIKDTYYAVAAEIYYIFSVFVLLLACMGEWYFHCDLNIAQQSVSDVYAILGTVAIFAASVLLLSVRPICPKGSIRTIAAFILGLAGSLFTIFAIPESYRAKFTIFANANFAFALLFVVALLICAKSISRERCKNSVCSWVSYAFALLSIFLLWGLLIEQIYTYWYCQNHYGDPVKNWRFIAQMYISVMWAIYGGAIMVIGFWFRVKSLRYIALGLFVLLICKIFIFDMSTVKNVFRIAAFLATGITLVGISYLYQYLKKKGFFEAKAVQNKLED